MPAMYDSRDAEICGVVERKLARHTGLSTYAFFFRVLAGDGHRPAKSVSFE